MSRFESSPALGFSKKTGDSVSQNQRDQKSGYCESSGK